MENYKVAIMELMTMTYALVVPNSISWRRNIFSEREKIYAMAAALGFLILIFSPAQADADMPAGGFQQRIGNYDVSVKTDSPQPQTDTRVSILITVNAIYGDEISGVPMDISIVGEEGVLASLDRPVAVNGHYTYQHTFEKPGIYSLDLAIYDIYFTGRQVEFTFPVEVQSSLFGLWYASEMPVGIIVISSIIVVPTAFGVVVWRRHKAKLRNMPQDDKRL
jgi:hypothetical protein